MKSWSKNWSCNKRIPIGSSICMMSRHSQQDKCCKKGVKNVTTKMHAFFPRIHLYWLQKMEKRQQRIAKHCCVEFAVVNFVGRIKTAIKKSFQTYSIYSPTVCKGVYGEVTQLCTAGAPTGKKPIVPKLSGFRAKIQKQHWNAFEAELSLGKFS